MTIGYSCRSPCLTAMYTSVVLLGYSQSERYYYNLILLNWTGRLLKCSGRISHNFLVNDAKFHKNADNYGGGISVYDSDSHSVVMIKALWK